MEINEIPAFQSKKKEKTGKRNQTRIGLGESLKFQLSQSNHCELILEIPAFQSKKNQKVAKSNHARATSNHAQQNLFFYFRSGKRDPQSSPNAESQQKPAGKLTKKQERAQKAAVVIMPLADLPPLVRDPNQWLPLKASFQSAIDTKTSAWFVNSTEAEGPTNVVEKFKADFESMLETEEVKALPIDEVCEKATISATAILKFKADMRTWSLPCPVEKLRKQLNELFQDYDKALEDLHLYKDTIDGWEAKQEIDGDKISSKAKRHLKDMRTRMFNRLCNEGHPKLVGKVMGYLYL